MKIFDAETKQKAGDRTRVLFMDGHNSHYTPELLKYAQEHNIEILGYPPHCTHALQGLDVACFAKMKECWKEEIHTFEEKNRCGVNKADFASVWGTAYLRAFTPDLVKAAFSATGICPFNPDVITPEQMKPSACTSTQHLFPLPQTSPVRAIMAAFRYYQPTSFELSPDTHVPIQPDPTGTLPSSPSPKHARDPDIDPDLYTPSKRMRLLTSALSGTASGSYLVSKTRITAAQASKIVVPPALERPPPLPSPDWSLLDSWSEENGYRSQTQLQERIAQLTNALKHAQQQIMARNLIIEGAQAQLVIQGMALAKMKESVEAKENKRTSDRSHLFPGGKGLVLTGS
jgi:hypothetical protein